MSVRVERRLGQVTDIATRFPRVRTDDALAAVRMGVCPFCGSGPFVVVAIHIQSKHGIDRKELRDWLGLFLGEQICDPTHSKVLSDSARRALAAGKREVPLAGRGYQRRATSVRMRHNGDRNKYVSTDRWCRLRLAHECGATVNQLAQIEGVNVDLIYRGLGSVGVTFQRVASSFWFRCDWCRKMTKRYSHQDDGKLPHRFCSISCAAQHRVASSLPLGE